MRCSNWRDRKACHQCKRDWGGPLECIGQSRRSGRTASLHALRILSAALEVLVLASAETGWQACHLLIEPPPSVLKPREKDGDRSRSEGEISGLMPLYFKSHSQGEYVFDHAWADALERAGGDYYPKLQCAVPFTPVTGPRLLAQTAEAKRALLQSAAAVLKRTGSSSLHITFLTRAEWEAAGAVGYLQRHRPAISLGKSRLCLLRRIPGGPVLRQAQDAAQRAFIGPRCRGYVFRMANRR